MDYFPIFINLKQQKCLVVGAGHVALRKIELLHKANVNITVLAECFDSIIEQKQAEYGLTLINKRVVADDVKGYRLVISATDDIATNQLVATACQQHDILVNVVDNPELSSFIFPAIIDRSPLVVAISSSGTAPVLARLLRAKIEAAIPPAYGQLAQLAEKYRDTVKQRLTTLTARRMFWENVLQGSVAEAVFNGNMVLAETQLQQQLAQTEQHAIGEVYLIGAGPGAADLLTFKALRLMQQADVIVYDHLVSQEILELARRDADKVYVGKQRKNHSLPQESINQLLAELAKSGKRVARLKGGDPFIFGRGGEEIETLMQQGIHFQVVPGITAATGCAAYAGIPLTHRDHAQSCVFVTGHLKNDTIHLNWTELAAPNQTVVIYMGSVGLEKICHALMQHGSPSDLPIALIQQGTTKTQVVITGTLATIVQKVARITIQPPTLIIIGTVVNLHQKLNWFQTE